MTELKWWKNDKYWLEGSSDFEQYVPEARMDEIVKEAERLGFERAKEKAVEIVRGVTEHCDVCKEFGKAISAGEVIVDRLTQLKDGE